MIRGTKNESISTAAKKRHSGGLLDYTGTKSQSYELIKSTATGALFERRDEFDIHSTLESDLPANAFNGPFE